MSSQLVCPSKAFSFLIQIFMSRISFLFFLGVRLVYFLSLISAASSTCCKVRGRTGDKGGQGMNAPPPTDPETRASLGSLQRQATSTSHSDASCSEATSWPLSWLPLEASQPQGREFSLFLQVPLFLKPPLIFPTFCSQHP